MNAKVTTSKRRWKRRPGLPLGAQIFVWKRLSAILRERRLRVEGIDMRRPAIEEKVDHTLCLRREMRSVRRERICRVRAKRCGHRIREADRAHSHAAAAKEIAAADRGGCGGRKGHGHLLRPARGRIQQRKMTAAGIISASIGWHCLVNGATGTPKSHGHCVHEIFT